MTHVPGHRVILHLDMDAFYAAVEVREDPRLAGRPLIIGHRGRRGVVSTCSYEARRFGVRSAMPSVTAERFCPQAVWLPVRMDLYAGVSRRIRRILEACSPIVEPISIDEAFLDLTGVVADLTAPAGGAPAASAAGVRSVDRDRPPGRDRPPDRDRPTDRRPVVTLEDGAAVGRFLKDRIRQAERLTASVGVAPNKFLAKVASDLEKPDGLVVLPVEAVPDRLWPLPVERLWGIGPRTAPRLHDAGLRTIGDLAASPGPLLDRLVGPESAAHLKALARGEDDRPVVTDRESKSISEERTYGEDLRDPDAIDRALLARSEGVARQLRRERLVAGTVRLKVRTGDFTTWTRARSIPDPTDLTEVILATARDLLRDRIPIGRQGIRLLGVGVSGLRPAAARQIGLFETAGADRARRAARVTDAVRARLGEAAITRARLLRPPRPSSPRRRKP
jgi:nucleotidyltransferase/DNA polymerase involved in DNA repair